MKRGNLDNERRSARTINENMPSMLRFEPGWLLSSIVFFLVAQLASFIGFNNELATFYFGYLSW